MLTVLVPEVLKVLVPKVRWRQEVPTVLVPKVLTVLVPKVRWWREVPQVLARCG